MKKILLLVTLMALSCAAIFAQGASKNEIKSRDFNATAERGTRAAADWGTFTNFTATDMQGVSHNIQSYLDQGKYVVIDFFCAWCNPCWQLHQTGILEDLYEQYGQGAENGDMIVLMCETETTNTAAQITGTTTANNYAGASQGDFTNGGTNPVPIIDATSNLAGKVSLYEGYVPSIYMFCPSGFVRDIYTEIHTSAAAVHNLIGSCPTVNDAPMADINEPDVVKRGQTARFTSYVVSASDDVTYSWTFEGAATETATTSSVNVIWNEVGEYDVSLTVTNANGSYTANTTIYVVDCAVGIDEYPYVQNFEQTIGCWTSSSKNSANRSEMGIVEYSDGMHGFRFSSYSQASNYNQYLISPLLNHNGVLDLSFKYKVATSQYPESFKVMYSTSGTSTTNFIEIEGTATTSSSTRFTDFNCTVPADAKYIMINYYSNYMYYLYVDDIRIEANHEEPTSIDEASVNGISVFPNPTTGIVNIAAEGLTNVAIYDVTGRVVMSKGAESSIDISELEAGVYFVNVATENGSAMKRIVKE